MITLKLARLTAGAFVVAALASGRPAQAGTSFGVRTGVYADADAGFVGGEVLTSLPHSWSFNPNLEIALAGSNDIVTVNGDFHYDFLKDRPYYVWAGGGPAVIHRENPPVDLAATDFGLNLLGGIAWKTAAKVSPYLQGKVTVSDNDEAVLAFGVRF